MKDKKVMV